MASVSPPDEIDQEAFWRDVCDVLSEHAGLDVREVQAEVTGLRDRLSVLRPDALALFYHHTPAQVAEELLIDRCCERGLTAGEAQSSLRTFRSSVGYG